MEVKAIVFDFGGVLMDWDPRYLYSRIFDGNEAAMERFLAEVGFFDWNARQDAGRSFSAAVEELSARYPHYAGLIQAYDARWEESLGGPIWGTVAILKALHRAGFPLYALSNWSAEKFPLVRRKFDFFDWFEDIVLSGEMRLIKPDPRIFTAFLERIKLTAPECLLIDDSQANLEAAREMGFHTLHFQSPQQLGGELVRLQLLLSGAVSGIS
jgi:2-haloacid dehalogenase